MLSKEILKKLKSTPLSQYVIDNFLITLLRDKRLSDLGVNELINEIDSFLRKKIIEISDEEYLNTFKDNKCLFKWSQSYSILLSDFFDKEAKTFPNDSIYSEDWVKDNESIKKHLPSFTYYYYNFTNKEILFPECILLKGGKDFINLKKSDDIGNILISYCTTEESRYLLSKINRFMSSYYRAVHCCLIENGIFDKTKLNKWGDLDEELMELLYLNQINCSCSESKKSLFYIENTEEKIKDLLEYIKS